VTRRHDRRDAGFGALRRLAILEREDGVGRT